MAATRRQEEGRKPTPGRSYVEIGEASLCLGVGMRAATQRWCLAKVLVPRAPAEAWLSGDLLRVNFEERGAHRAFDQRHSGTHLHWSNHPFPARLETAHD